MFKNINLKKLTSLKKYGTLTGRMVSTRTMKLSNGVEMPILGLGTWRSKPGEVTEAVKHALDAGYRHIDCAYFYENENEVGDGLWTKIKQGLVKREDVFITSKLWNTCHRPDLVEKSIRKSLKDLRLDYLDLYLIHFPHAYKEGDALDPLDKNGDYIFSDVDYIDTWKAMEPLLKSGLTRAIGVSNFNSEQIKRLLANSTVPPVMNQFECHPYLNQNRLIEFCKSKNIAVTAYSQFGSGEFGLLDDPKLIKIGKKYGKSSGHVILRWIVQKKIFAIPKSVTKNRIISNAEIFDFELSADDMKEVDSLDRNLRLILIPEISHHKYYPFKIDF